MTAVPLEVDIGTCSSAILDNLKTFTTYVEEALRNAVIYNCCVFLPTSCTSHVTVLMAQAAPALANTYIPEPLHTTSLNSSCNAYSDSGFVKHTVPLGSTLSSAPSLIHIIDLSHVSMHGLNLYILLVLLSLYTTLKGTAFKIPFIMSLPKYTYITFDTILFMNYAMNKNICIKLNIGYGNKTVNAETTKVLFSSSSSS